MRSKPNLARESQKLDGNEPSLESNRDEACVKYRRLMKHRTRRGFGAWGSRLPARSMLARLFSTSSPDISSKRGKFDGKPDAELVA